MRKDSRFLQTVAVMGGLLAGAISARGDTGVEAAPGSGCGGIPAGIDCPKTNSGTSFSFADQPIPGSFFGDGYSAFNGTISLVARPGVRHDTVIRRHSEMCFEEASVNDPPGVLIDSTSIEVELLDLISAAPIIVMFGSTQTYWDVAVDLSEASDPPPGLMTVRKTHEDGGTFTSEFFLFPRFQFNVHVGGRPADFPDHGCAGGDPNCRMLDLGKGKDPTPIRFTTSEPTPWIRVMENGRGSNAGHCGFGFIPGVAGPDVVWNPEERALRCGLDCAGYWTCCWSHKGPAPGHLHSVGTCLPCP